MLCPYDIAVLLELIEQRVEAFYMVRLSLLRSMQYGSQLSYTLAKSLIIRA